MVDLSPRITNPFGKLIHHINRLLDIRLQRNFRSSGYDITAEQWRVLINLWHQNAQTQQQLSEATGKDKGNMARIITALENRELVVRMPNHADGRSKLIHLTAKGKDCQKELIKIAKKTLQESQRRIQSDEMKLCLSILNKVYDNLKI